MIRMSFFLRLVVWEAAVGKPEQLARLLRSEFPLSKPLREELALLIEGKLVREKRSRGRPKTDRLVGLQILDQLTSDKRRAFQEFDLEWTLLRESGQAYGKRDILARRIAEKWKIPEETFLNDLRRPRRPELSVPSTSETADFQRWVATRTQKKDHRK